MGEPPPSIWYILVPCRQWIKYILFICHMPGVYVPASHRWCKNISPKNSAALYIRFFWAGDGGEGHILQKPGWCTQVVTELGIGARFRTGKLRGARAWILVWIDVWMYAWTSAFAWMYCVDLVHVFLAWMPCVNQLRACIAWMSSMYVVRVFVAWMYRMNWLR